MKRCNTRHSILKLDEMLAYNRVYSISHNIMDIILLN
jgi:hypothetical protein